MKNDELTAIYNEANGLDPKRHNPITTERIFAAMRAAMVIEREACATACERQAQLQMDTGSDDCCVAQAKRCARDIRMRSN